MKAIQIIQPGGLDALQLVEMNAPEVKPGYVKIKVIASSINHLDIWVRKGLPGSPYPLIPGSDGAGIVESVGEGVENIKPGDRVVLYPADSCHRCERCISGHDNLCPHYKIMGESAQGYQCEFTVIPAYNVFPLAESLTFETAAAGSLAYLTAWQMVVEKANINKGDFVFIWGAGSGVGIAAIQMAKMLGAMVITTSSSQSKLDKAKALGADWILNYKNEDPVKWVKTMLPKKAVDVVIEHPGADTIMQSIRMTKNGGQIITCGATSGYEAKIDLRHIFFRQLSIIGSTMGRRDSFSNILMAIESGQLKPVIDSVMGMSEIRQAHQRVESAAHFGKVVLVNDF